MFCAMRSYEENTHARSELRRRSISYWPQRPAPSLFDRLSGEGGIVVGDLNKSWDVLRAVETLQKETLQNKPIVDLGAFASEVICSLHLAGFKQLTGVDLNPRIRKMPFSESVKYLNKNMMATGLASHAYAAVLAMSSLEHGYQPELLLREVSRLLCAGGLFVGSTDYWKEKIDTSGARMFGLSWCIFSEMEIRNFFEMARRFDLAPIGDLDFSVGSPDIECMDRLYTFGFFALRKIT